MWRMCYVAPRPCGVVAEQCAILLPQALAACEIVPAALGEQIGVVASLAVALQVSGRQ